MIEKGFFYIELDQDKPLDIGNLSKEDWREIDKLAKQIIEAKQSSHEKVAFVAGFLHYIMTKQTLKQPFGCQH